MKPKALLFIMLLSLSVVALFTLNTGVFAQSTTGKISGTVTDTESNEPLPGVNIIVEGTVLGAATDPEGHYYIINVPPGTYTLRATMIGYAAQVVSDVQVNIDRVVTVDMGMRTTALEAAEEVVVTAERDIVPMDLGNTQVSITDAQVEAVPVVDFNTLLSTMPGFQGTTIRGGDLSESNIFIDGLSTYDERTNRPNLLINLSSIKQVQVQTGGFNAEYGNVRSGVVNVITKEGSNRYQASINYRYSPAARKHKGPPFYGPGSHDWQFFAGPDALEAKAADTKWGYPAFAGWNAIATDPAERNAVAFPFTDMNGEQAQMWWKWLHRGQKYGNVPDTDIETSFGGPLIPQGINIPILSKIRFFLTYRNVYQQQIFPEAWYRNFAKMDNITSKFTMQLTDKTKITVNANYSETKTIGAGGYHGRGGSGGSDVASFQTPLLIPNAGSRGALFIPKDMKYNGTRCPADYFNSLFGITVNHVFSPNAFLEASLSRSYNKYFNHRPVMRPSTNDPDFVVPTEAKADGTEEAGGIWIAGHWISERPWGYNAKIHFDCPKKYHMENGNSAYDYSSGETVTGRASLTWQVNRTNMIKTGFEFNFSNLDFDFGSTRPAAPGVGTHKAYYDAEPVRGSFYVQDRIEFEGMIANLGLRVDYLDPGGYVVDDHGDPFGDIYRRSSTDYDGIEDYYNTYFADPENRYRAKSKATVSPRLSISHPITENAKIYFNYGHFYSMPNSERMFHMMLDCRTTRNKLYNVGNPDLPFQRTIQYELGYDHNLFNTFLLHIVGYYKDSSDLHRNIRYLAPKGVVNYGTQDANMIGENRGFELQLSKNFGRFITGFANLNYNINTTRRLGDMWFYENEKTQNPTGNSGGESDARRYSKPYARPSFRMNISLHTPINWTAGILGTADIERHVTGGWTLSVLHVWRKGNRNTYNPTNRWPGVEDNRYYIDHQNTDLRLTKSFQFGRIRPQFSLEVFNLFDREELNMSAYQGGRENAYYDSMFDQVTGEMLPGKKVGQLIGDVVDPETGEITYGMPERESMWFLNKRDIYFGMRINYSF